MRQPLVMGNWKLNGTKASVEALVKALVEPAAKAEGVEVAVCPPVIFLDLVEKLTEGTRIQYGAQNADVHTAGAFTGENSPVMLKEFGCKYALVGHSERRTLHAETDEVVAAKYEAIQQNGLVPVLCIGETLAQFEAGQTNAVVETQLKAVIDRCGIDSFANAVIAYEPVWAIGTGVTASPAQAQAVHRAIRTQVAERDAGVAGELRILYGGSVKPQNAAELFAQPDIDGGLIGGASLVAEDFLAICRAAS